MIYGEENRIEITHNYFKKNRNCIFYLIGEIGLDII